MNFKTMLQESKTISNNKEICELQQEYESQAWVSPTIAQKLKNAVKWLRDNPDKTAQEAIERFFQN